MNDSFWVYVYPLPVKLALQFLSGKLTPRAVNVQRHPPFLFVCLHCFVSFLFGSRLVPFSKLPSGMASFLSVVQALMPRITRGVYPRRRHSALIDLRIGLFGRLAR